MLTVQAFILSVQLDSFVHVHVHELEFELTFVFVLEVEFAFVHELELVHELAFVLPHELELVHELEFVLEFELDQHQFLEHEVEHELDVELELEVVLELVLEVVKPFEHEFLRLARKKPLVRRSLLLYCLMRNPGAPTTGLQSTRCVLHRTIADSV